MKYYKAIDNNLHIFYYRQNEKNIEYYDMKDNKWVKSAIFIIINDEVEYYDVNAHIWTSSAHYDGAERNDFIEISESELFVELL